MTDENCATPTRADSDGWPICPRHYCPPNSKASAPIRWKLPPKNLQPAYDRDTRVSRRFSSIRRSCAEAAIYMPMKVYGAQESIPQSWAQEKTHNRPRPFIARCKTYLKKRL